MIRPIKLVAAAALAASLLPASPADATTLVRMSLEQLTQASSIIVRGHVLSAESRWSPDGSRIVTLTAVAVDQVMKGEPAKTLVVQQLGGTVGNRHVFVPGSARLDPHASYMLFLEPAGVGSENFLVVGMEQGALRIVRDERTGQENVIEPAGEFHVGTATATAAQALPLTQFQQGLARALEAPVLVPRHTSLPLIIESTEPDGVGRLQVLGRTTRDVYPTAKSMIPAGSAVAGRAQLQAGVWRIHWDEILVRGAEVRIEAVSEEPNAGGALRHRALLVEVR